MRWELFILGLGGTVSELVGLVNNFPPLFPSLRDVDRRLRAVTDCLWSTTLLTENICFSCYETSGLRDLGKCWVRSWKLGHKLCTGNDQWIWQEGKHLKELEGIGLFLPKAVIEGQKEGWITRSLKGICTKETTFDHRDTMARLQGVEWERKRERVF